MIDIDVWWIKTKNTHWWWLDHQRTSEFRELRRSVLASGDWREIYIYKYSICVYYNACVLYGNGTFISANGMIYVYWYKNMYIYIYMYIKIFTCIYRCLYTYLYCGEINFCRVFQPHSIVADEAAIDHRCAVLADSSARALKIRKMWKISGENPSGKDVFSTSMLVFSRVWWVCVYIYIYIWYMYVCFVYVYTYVRNRIYLYTYKKGMKRPTYPKFHGWSASRREFGMVDTCCSTQIT